MGIHCFISSSFAYLFFSYTYFVTFVDVNEKLLLTHLLKTKKKKRQQQQQLLEKTITTTTTSLENESASSLPLTLKPIIPQCLTATKTLHDYVIFFSKRDSSNVFHLFCAIHSL